MTSKSNFSDLDEILRSLVDFIRPETFVATDELEKLRQIKDKIRRKSTNDVEIHRTNSSIYRFLGQHSTSTKKSSSTPIDRENLLKKLHEKLVHRERRPKNVERPAKPKSNDERRTPKRKFNVENETKTIERPTKKSRPEKIESSLSFGRFDFSTDDHIEKTTKTTKKKKNDLKKTLKRIEEEDEQLKSLNPDESKEILRSKHWKTALAKAKGEKVRDNVQLLKKSIKKEEKRKAHAAKKWKVKKAETNKRMKERQDKRQTNLQKRKEDKKAKLKKRLIKKGRLIS